MGRYLRMGYWDIAPRNYFYKISFLEWLDQLLIKSNAVIHAYNNYFELEEIKTNRDAEPQVPHRAHQIP